MGFLKKHVVTLLSLFVIIVLVQSLFFKFSNSPETIYIFEGKLEPWAASLGYPGLFAKGGIFSAVVVGTFELLTSIVLLLGLVLKKPLIQAIGGIMGIKVISGAIFFHLFTPLGIAVINTDGSSDGGELFIMACLIFTASALIVFFRRSSLLALIGK